MKTQTPSNVSFKVQGVRDAKTDAINGDIEGKWTDKIHGLALTQSWTTSNILRNQVELDNFFVKGLKFDLATSLSPDKGTKTALLNTVYKQSGLHTRATLDVFKVRLLPKPLIFLINSVLSRVPPSLLTPFLAVMVF